MGVLGSLISGIAGVASSAITSGINLKAQREVNKLNQRLAEEANRTNIAINRETNQTNLQLAREEQAYNEEMWNKQNAYNDPSAQLARYQSAGINPNFQETDLSNGNAQELTSPSLANQQVGNPVVAPQLSAPQLQNPMKDIADVAMQLSEIKSNKSKANLDNAQTLLTLTQNEYYQQQVKIAEQEAKFAPEMAMARVSELDVSIKNLRGDFAVKQAQYGLIRANMRGVLEGLNLKWAELQISAHNSNINAYNAMTQRYNNEELIRHNKVSEIKDLVDMTFKYGKKVEGSFDAVGKVFGVGVDGSGSYSQTIAESAVSEMYKQKRLVYFLSHADPKDVEQVGGVSKVIEAIQIIDSRYDANSLSEHFDSNFNSELEKLEQGY